MKNLYLRNVATLALGGWAASSFAQETGSISYAPYGAVPLPAALLVPLSLLLAALGVRFLGKNGHTSAAKTLLLAGGAMTLISNGALVRDVTAITFEMSNPSGGSVDAPLGLQAYPNTSGVPLLITGVTPPSHCGSENVTNTCVTGLEVPPGGQCETSFNSCTPVVSISASAAGEESANPTNASFTLTRTGDTAAALTVNFSLAGSATIDSDYTVASPTSVTFAAGEASATIDISVLDDQDYDPLETVELTLSSSADYDLGAISQQSLEITALDKRLYVTDINTRTLGDLRVAGDTTSATGTAGADAICNSDTLVPSGGEFKAVLASSDRSAIPQVDWVLQAGYKYFKSYNGSQTFLSQADADALLEFPLTQSPGSQIGVRVWTGMYGDWTASGLNCSDWTNAVSTGKATVGGAAKNNSGILYVARADLNCSSSVAALICAEQ